MNLDYEALVLEKTPGHPHKLETIYPIIKLAFTSPKTNNGFTSAFKLRNITRLVITLAEPSKSYWEYGM